MFFGKLQDIQLSVIGYQSSVMSVWVREDYEPNRGLN